MKFSRILGAVLLTFGVLVIGGLFCVGILGNRGNGVYYTQIDNSRMKEIKPNGGVVNFEGSLPYSYTLPCYDEEGKGQELTFSASKELREGAFLRLEKQPVRGVVGWTEVQYEELPEAAREKYEKPAE